MSVNEKVDESEEFKEKGYSRSNNSSSLKRMCQQNNERDINLVAKTFIPEGEGDFVNDHASMVHPLLIDHVARKLFTFLGWSYSKDMLSCRLVCKTWCGIITSGMKRKRKSRKLIFGNGDEKRFNRFLNAMSTTANLPFDSFEFNIHFFILRNTETFNDFLQLCGPYISDLSLSFGKHYSIDLNSDKMDYENFDLNSLKTLSIRCSELETMADCSYSSTSCTWIPQDSRSQSDGLYSLMKAILRTADNLESLNFNLPAKYFDGENSKPANEKFGNLLATSLPETVVNLSLIMDLNNEILSGLSKLKLESLNLEFYGTHISPKSFEGFMRYQSLTLKELRVMDYENVFCDKYFGFIEFNKVKILEVKKTEHSPLYLKSFPNLQTLILLPGKNTLKSTQTSNEPMMGSTISTLEIRFPIVCPNFVKSYFACMPNIAKLRFQATFDTGSGTQKIFELGKGLTEMHIDFPDAFRKQVVDGLFTGLPLGVCNRIREDEFYSEAFIPAPNRPCLTNLKNLKRLTIESEPYAIHLTEVSVRFALLRMPWLEEVVFTGGHNISKRWLQTLGEKLRVIEINDGVKRSLFSKEDEMALVPLSIS